MIEFLSLGIGVIVLLGAALIIEIIAAELESTFLSAATFIVTLVALELFGVPVWDAITDNIIILIASIIAYAILGMLYAALYKWPRHIAKNSHEIGYSYDKFKKVYKNKNFEDFTNSEDYPFRAKYHKERIIAWAMSWPFSLLWHVSHKPITALWDYCYTLAYSLFDNIGKRLANKYKIDD